MIEYGGEERQQIRPGPDSHIHPESPIMLLVKNLAPFFFISCYFWFYLDCPMRLPAYITSACVSKNTLLKEP